MHKLYELRVGEYYLIRRRGKEFRAFLVDLSQTCALFINLETAVLFTKARGLGILRQLNPEQEVTQHEQEMLEFAIGRLLERLRRNFTP